jgi:hypothetical protein
MFAACSRQRSTCVQCTALPRTSDAQCFFVAPKKIISFMEMTVRGEASKRGPLECLLPALNRVMPILSLVHCTSNRIEWRVAPLPFREDKSKSGLALF